MRNAYDTDPNNEGRDVCLILGFQNIGDALTKKFKKAYKASLHAICETHMTPASNNEE